MKTKTQKPLRSKWFGIWKNETGYLLSVELNTEEIEKFIGEKNFRLILKENKLYRKGTNRPKLLGSIGNYWGCNDNVKTSESLQYECYNDSRDRFMKEFLEELKSLDETEIIDKYQELTGNRLYTEYEVDRVKYGACEDGQRGYSGGDLLIDDYI